MTDKQMTLSLSYGDRSGIYTGEVNEQGVPNGKGKFTTQNAQGNPWVYEGDFKNGHFEGQGVPHGRMTMKNNPATIQTIA